MAQMSQMGKKAVGAGVVAAAGVAAYLMLAPVQPYNITLAWDASPDTNVVGYNVYWGVGSRCYTGMVCAGAQRTVTISNLVRGTTYFFAATAYDSWGLESDFSPECAWPPLMVLWVDCTGPLMRSTNLVNWVPAVKGYVTNPPAPCFWRGTNAVIRRIQ